MADRRTGQSVWVADFENAAGIAGDAEVLYPDCFKGDRGFSANLRYKLTLSGVAQDMVLHTVLPDPTELGFPPESEIMTEIWTAVLDAPEGRTSNEIVNGEGLQAVDSRVDFGSMHLGRDAAFPLEKAVPNRVAMLAKSVPVVKECVEVGGIQWLIPYLVIAPQLGKLRPLLQQIKAEGRSVLLAQSLGILRGRSLPISLTGAGYTPQTEVATTRMERNEAHGDRWFASSAYVLDWDLNTGSVSNFPFGAISPIMLKALQLFARYDNRTFRDQIRAGLFS